MVAVLDSDSAAETLAAFQADYEAFKALEEVPDKSASLRSLQKRSVFNHTSVQQLVAVPPWGRHWLSSVRNRIPNPMSHMGPVGWYAHLEPQP